MAVLFFHLFFVMKQPDLGTGTCVYRDYGSIDHCGRNHMANHFTDFRRNRYNWRHIAVDGTLRTAISAG